MKSLRKIQRTSWKKTLRQISAGESSKITIVAGEVNAIRVAAAELNRANEGNYSISISGNTAIITNKSIYK
jgi:hypothetical protein